MKVRAHVYISGMVQGVFYRASTRDAAKRIGVAGWVRNLPNGDVEAVFEGEKERVERMIEWCRSGPRAARVDDVRVEWEPPQDEDDFAVRYF
ncbi:MAG: acylphosphatase [Candidatus Altiarchaeales archaeon WOR_SM1_86-2]|nr:MAG: acylphosphatase [Candidatus Altiarchaeales archaeon WOR_SM1_86-2]